MQGFDNMERLVRIVWFVSCPLLAVTTTVHVPLEHATAVEIEHNVNIEARHRGSIAQTPECHIPTISVASPNDALPAGVWDAFDRRTASNPVCADTQTVAARAITILESIRLLV